MVMSYKPLVALLRGSGYRLGMSSCTVVATDWFTRLDHSLAFEAQKRVLTGQLKVLDC